jgi:2-polyprenyl-3-methyl-5-hydroxy-6-metoxy-1,4-benzoquinol methylase
MKWVEMGCGAGYFLSSLEDHGISNYVGFDRNESLINEAKRHLKNKKVFSDIEERGGLTKKYGADLYAAFFVFEHLENPYDFYASLKKMPQGTILIFSVPVYGLSCLLENIFANNFARNLDGVVHTQLYTDESIKWAMKLADFDIKAQWIFGQDADDLVRFIGQNLKGKLAGKDISNYEKKLNSISDDIQKNLDKASLSDQRHIIAIKK